MGLRTKTLRYTEVGDRLGMASEGKRREHAGEKTPGKAGRGRRSPTGGGGHDMSRHGGQACPYREGGGPAGERHRKARNAEFCFYSNIERRVCFYTLISL
jgi:hypothetical protein